MIYCDKYDEELPDFEDLARMCPACHSGIGLVLGRLGNMLWYRCRDCGMEFGHKEKKS